MDPAGTSEAGRRIGAPLRRRLDRLHVNHRKIAGNALLIGVLTLIAKLFVAGREVAIAWRYGVSGTVDAYQLALTIVTWIPMFLYGALGVVLVPRLVKLRRNDDSRNQFVGELNGSVLLLAMGVVLVTYLLSPIAARLLASSLQSDTLNLTATMAMRMAPVAFLITIAGYLTARLQARERFSYTATEALPAIAIAFLVAGPFALGPTMPLTLGTVLGFALQLLVLALLVLRGDPPLGRLRFRHVSDEWRTIYGSALMMALGQLIITAANPIDQAFAARVASGAVATLGYASRILTLLTGLGTVIIGRALLPVLSQEVADGDLRRGRRHTLQWTALMFCAAAAGTLLFWILLPELVRLLFERGAFEPSATAAVSAAARYGALQLPFYFAGIVLVQWYAANGRFRDLLLITIAALVLKVVLNVILAPLLGVSGIMLSTALMYALTCSLLIFRLGDASGKATPRDA